MRFLLLIVKGAKKMSNIIAENDDMYFYRAYYLLEALFMVEKRNDERVKYGRESVNIDSKMSHDMLDKYIHGKCQELAHNRAMGESIL